MKTLAATRSSLQKTPKGNNCRNAATIEAKSTKSDDGVCKLEVNLPADTAVGLLSLETNRYIRKKSVLRVVH